MLSFLGGVSVESELWNAISALHRSRTREGWWGVARTAYDEAVCAIERRVDLVVARVRER
jgi:hypothetical protein